MKKLFLLPYIIFGLAANATDYYVSSSGNDANNGTSTSTPWKTIARINSSSFLPGDFIFFRRGDTWREQLNIPSSGSAGSLITFGAYGAGAKPVINGADVITGWTNSAANIWWVNNPNAVTTRAMVVINGVIYSEAASLAALTSTNTYFIDAAASPDRLYVYSTTNPGNLTAEVSKREFCIQTSGNSKRFIEINDIEVRYAGRAGIYFEGPGTSTTNAFNGSSVVRRCTAYANRQFGMAHVDHYDNVLFEDCEANYNGNGFYSWVADEGTFRRCSTANQIHYESTSAFTDGGAIQSYQGDNWLVENCYSINDYDAIHIDCGGVAANAIIRYNKVFNSRAGSPNTPTMGVGSLAAGARIQIYYNLLVNGASAAFECYSLMNGTVEFYNNTIYLKPGTGTDGTIYLKYGNNFIFKNNLITREGATRGFVAVLNPAVTVNDYNLYYNFPPVYNSPFFYQVYYASLAGWRSATGQDMNSQVADPLFVNVASDWRLQANSPAINKGVDVGLTKDILGNPIVGLPDIGAYEQGNAAPNQPPTANAGGNITLTLPTNSTTLTGTGTDTDGIIASYAWSRMSGPATFTLVSANAATTALDNLVQGTYVFRLTVTDNSGATSTDDVTVTVNAAPNQPPTANAGNNITLTLPTNSTTLTGSGTDTDGTIASYAWSRLSGPATFTLASANAATTPLNNLVQGTYVFRLTVADNSGATGTDDVTVTVNAAPNQVPTANAGSNITLTLPTNSTTLIGSGTDTDGTIASYGWSRVSGPATFTLVSANAATTALTNLVQGTYVFRLTVTDNSGATATDDVTVTVNVAPNQAPTANAGGNITLTLPTNSTTLTGTGTDTDGIIASYAWSRMSGPATFTLVSANAATTALDNLVQGTYVFRLTVTDNSGATSTDDVTVTVNAAPNQPPTANAGNNITLTLPTNSTTLTGTGTDIDGTIASYAWSRVSGPTTFTLISANAATTALNNLVQGTYVFRLTVTDNSGATATDDVNVTVNAAPNQPPTANAGGNITLTLPTNSTTLTGTGTDADGTIASYAWSRVSGPATFTLVNANAATTALNSLVLGTYVFRLTVTDNRGATATDDVTVTVNAAPNQAPTANAGGNITLTLPTNSTTLTGTGTDADGTIASYAWSRVSGPATFTLVSANAATTALNSLVLGTYVFRLTVTDNSGATATDDVTVTVNAAPNQPPTANAGSNITLTLPTNSTTLTGTGTDADGTIASYAWSRVSGPATFTLVNANAATTALNNLVLGTYVFRLTVTDNSGATATDDVTVTVNAAPNQPPTANAGSNITLTLPTNSTTLTGTGTDADGTIASYAWSRMSGPTTFTLISANAATTALTNLVQGIYVFRLTVTDNNGATATDDLTVIVNAAPVINQLPVANAGNNIVLTLPTNATTLTGTGTDTDGTIASYAWSRVSGPTTFTLVSANAATTALNNLVQGTYVFRLTVTDNSGATATDDVTVTVNAAPNQAPTANAGGNITLTLPTNSTTLTGTGTDADGTIASYAWSRVSGPATFTLVSANAATTALNSLVLGTYVFRLTVTDNSGATATDDVTVTVNAAPNQAPTANAGGNITLTLPTNSTTLTGTGTDADGTIASYAWSRVSGPATFTLVSANAATTALNSLVLGTYVFRLTVTDNSGATATDDVTVTVNAAPNQPPTANAGNNITLTLPTNSTTLTGSGTDSDGTIASYAWSRLSGPATFTLASANAATTTLNNLVQGNYVFRLTVTDNNGATATDDVTVTVNAAPNQPPTANSGNNITLTLPTNSTTLTGSGTDTDGTIASYAWSRLSGPATFTLASANAATTPLNNLVQGTYVFRLTVADNSGATGTDDVTVTVNAAPNQVPTANAGSNITLTLPTNSTTLIGSGTDTDGTIASYGWSRVSGPATFTLVSANAATTALTNLVQGTYVFRLTVTDNSGATATDDVTVTVNVAPNQAPTANAGGNITLTLPTNSTTLTGTGTDTDGIIASYAWSRMSGPATFTLVSANAATTALDNLVQGTYVFRLTVTDNSGATSTDDVTVTVNAAPNQPPTANAGGNITLTLPTNSTTLTGTGTDIDGTIASYAWSRVSGPTTFTLISANAATTALNNLVQGTYVFRLTVTDNSGATATDDVTVTVNPAPNQAPTANAGNNITLTLPTNSTSLIGSGTDTDGTIASYAWSRVSGPTTFTLISANAATTALTNLVQGIYVFRLTVTDNRGATATDDVTVAVNAVLVANQPPIANAGLSYAVTLSSNEAILNGSFSIDPDGVINSYKWEQISGPSGAVFASASSVTTKVTGFREGDYIFQLTVTDNLNATAKDTVTISVVNNFRLFQGDIMLYPNPATDEINFNMYNERYSTAEITIYDIIGRKVIPPVKVSNSQARFTKTIDIHSLKPGVYLIDIILNNQKRITLEFMKL